MNKDTYNFIRWMNKKTEKKVFTTWFSYYYDENVNFIIDFHNYEKEKNVIIKSFDENGIIVEKNNNNKIIFFDLDGTLYDLYNRNGWLECILSENTSCYTDGKLLINYDEFLSVVTDLKNKGYVFGVISWMAKNSSKQYENKVRKAKTRFLQKHFANVFDVVHIIQYGKNKSRYCENEHCILFDDEKNNRLQWEKRNGIAFDEKNIIERLKNL